MSDFWRCPHCQNTQEKSDQLKFMALAGKDNAIVYTTVTTRAYPCRYCGQTVDIGDVANGRLDCEVVSSREPDSEGNPPGPVGAFFMGAIAGGFVLGIIINVITGLGLESMLIGAVIGAVGFLIISLKSRK